MSKLEQLINELCPDGVEFVSLGSLMTKVTNKQKYSPEITQVYVVSNTLGMVKAEEYRENTIHSDDISNYTVVKTGMFAYNPSRLNIGSIAMLNKEDGVVSPMYVVFEVDTSKITLEYFELLIKSSFVKNKIASYKEEGARFRFDFSRWDWIKVQLPPIEIQNTIVEHLNTFSKYLDNLIDEHSARKQQYEYYRDYLLSFDDEDVEKVIPDIDCSKIEYKRLGDVCNVQSGGTPSKKESEYWNGGTIPWLASTVCKNKKSVEEVTNYITEKGLKNSSAKMMKEKTTLIALVGATIGKIAFLPFEASINQNIAGLFPIDENIINADYLFYACSTLYSKFQNLGNGKLAMANMSFVRNLVIPVPPLSVQENIVKILDRFDKLNNDMSEGLPAEIEARKKQYEYYRDTLLSFDDKACSHIVKVERERANTH